MSAIFSKANAFKTQHKINRISMFSFSIILSVAFYLFISIVGLVHIYTNNELLDDHGCSIGSLFCHGQTKNSSTLVISAPLYFHASQILIIFSIFSLSLLYSHPKRGPPSNLFSNSY